MEDLGTSLFQAIQNKGLSLLISRLVSYCDSSWPTEAFKYTNNLSEITILYLKWSI